MSVEDKAAPIDPDPILAVRLEAARERLNGSAKDGFVSVEDAWNQISRLVEAKYYLHNAMHKARDVADKFHEELLALKAEKPAFNPVSFAAGKLLKRKR